ncbi:hypothetical protein ACFC18_08710 [Streptomyces sp. NPDC056121]|uniref:hypothetical protein n=1 Tax=Streptomyces TaxID=1883 RepID=UPI001D0BA7D4|nr:MULTISPECIES: hypothetical protein [Streptomyces]MCX5082062.1 hypothetical protein [Streptomyces sp. NBC_00401]UDM00256.1 hypothetical protein LGI35_19195 [Streptomyces longhuiensis]
MTVQLDGAGRQLDELIAARREGAADKEVPVFVDDSGRRNRRYRRFGAIVGMICAVYAVVIVATLLSGNSSAPWLPIQGEDRDKPAGKVDTSPLPADPAARPSSSTGATAGPSASGTGAASSEPGAGSSTGPDSSASAKPGDKPGKSSDPKPSGGPGKPAPGNSPDPGPGPSEQPSSPDPGEPSPSDSGPPVEPSDSPAQDGTQTVAAPPVGPSQSPAGPSAASSPESGIL